MVAVFEAPPLATQAADGTWSGLGVALAVDVGQTLGRGVRFVGTEPDSAVAAVTDGRADLALARLVPGAEASMDAAPAFVDADLAVVRPASDQLLAVAARFFSPTFFKVAAGLSILLLFVGTLVWLAERNEDTDDFEEGARGLWDGFWWSGVTMTTIGYGDTVPKSDTGRVIALLWMLVSMAVTAVLTAALVSSLGLQNQSGSLRVPDDLEGDRIGVVSGSSTEAVLAATGVDAVAFETASAALAALDADSVDAVAGSTLHLNAAGASSPSLRIKTTGVAVERWALALADGSDLREPVARAVLDRVSGPDWPEQVRRYTSSD